jgi:nucleoside-diphosphate-sugar epimerase
VRILVLGGTRFLGPFVVNELLKRRHEVAVLSRRASALFDGPVRYFAGDASAGGVLHDTLATWQPEGLIDLLHHAPAHAKAVVQAGAGLTHTVHVSCSEVYGTAPICPIDERTELLRAEAARPEVAAQLAADEVVLAAMGEGRLAGTLVRLPQLYGPRDPRCAEWFFARRAREGRPRLALPDGGLAMCHRGFVQNMAWGVAQAATLPSAIGESYNLGEEKLYTLTQLAQGVARALRHEWELYSVPGHLWHTPYQYTSFFDLRKARAQLRYKDRMIPRDGLELTLAWLCQQPRGERWSWPGIEAPFDYAREDELIERHGVRIEAPPPGRQEI